MNQTQLWSEEKIEWAFSILWPLQESIGRFISLILWLIGTPPYDLPLILLFLFVVCWSTLKWLFQTPKVSYPLKPHTDDIEAEIRTCKKELREIQTEIIRLKSSIQGQHDKFDSVHTQGPLISDQNTFNRSTEELLAKAGEITRQANEKAVFMSDLDRELRKSIVQVESTLRRLVNQAK